MEHERPGANDIGAHVEPVRAGLSCGIHRALRLTAHHGLKGLSGGHAIGLGELAKAVVAGVEPDDEVEQVEGELARVDALVVELADEDFGGHGQAPRQ